MEKGSRKSVSRKDVPYGVKSTISLESDIPIPGGTDPFRRGGKLHGKMENTESKKVGSKENEPKVTPKKCQKQ